MKNSFLNLLRKIPGVFLSPFNWQYKIRTKIIWIILILGALPLTVFSFFASSMGTAYVFLDITQRNHEEAKQTAKSLDMYYVTHFEEIRRQVMKKSFPATPKPGFKKNLAYAKIFSNFFEDFPDILAISFVDHSGRSIAFDSPFTGAALNKIRKHVTMFGPLDARMIGNKIGPLQNWQDLNEFVVPLNIFISNLATKRIESFLIIYCSIKPFWKKYWEFHSMNDSGVILKNPTGQTFLVSYITSSGKMVYEKRTETSAQNRNRLTESPSFPIIPRSFSLGAVASFPALKWTIEIKKSKEILLRRLRNIRLFIFFFWAASFVFFLVGGIWFVSKLVRPLENLETGIKLVSSGLMGDELPVYSQDEIGRLTQTFNQMTRTLMLRNEEIRGKTRELTFFNTITRIINQSVDLKTILDSSLQKILQLMHATAGMSYIYQPSFKQFKLISCMGLSDIFINEAGQLDVNHTLLAKIFSNGEPSMLRDISNHTETSRFLRNENIRDLLLVPLRSKKRTLGVLGVGSRRKRFFHYRDLNLLARIGDEIGMMVENALLYSELQVKIKELENVNQELQELDRLKNRILSNVSHELRTPITSIKTYVELFLDDKIGNLEPHQKEKLLIIRRNINNLMTLISDLLTISRLEDQKAIVATPMEVVALSELIDQVIADTIEMAKVKGLSIIRKGMFENFLVKIHRQQIRQVLQNLMSNAIKFTEKGFITVSLRRVPLLNPADAPDASEASPGVEISVSDTGIGIPQEEIGKLFQRFYQVDSSSTRKYVGTGLGLAIVKEILMAHQSTPYVESEVGQGSRFWFILPLVNLPNKPVDF